MSRDGWSHVSHIVDYIESIKILGGKEELCEEDVFTFLLGSANDTLKRYTAQMLNIEKLAPLQDWEWQAFLGMLLFFKMLRVKKEIGLDLLKCKITIASGPDVAAGSLLDIERFNEIQHCLSFSRPAPKVSGRTTFEDRTDKLSPLQESINAMLSNSVEMLVRAQ